jgi:hypothetical protein
VSTNAAVTSTQTSLRRTSIAKTPESVIKKRASGGTIELCENQLHSFTEGSSLEV